MNPVLLFRGKGRVGVGEQLQYAKGIHVMFTPKAVINGPTMELYVKKFLDKVNTAWQLTQSNVLIFRFTMATRSY